MNNKNWTIKNARNYWSRSRIQKRTKFKGLKKESIEICFFFLDRPPLVHITHRKTVVLQLISWCSKRTSVFSGPFYFSIQHKWVLGEFGGFHPPKKTLDPPKFCNCSVPTYGVCCAINQKDRLVIIVSLFVQLKRGETFFSKGVWRPSDPPGVLVTLATSHQPKWLQDLARSGRRFQTVYSKAHKRKNNNLEVVSKRGRDGEIDVWGGGV